MKWRNNGWRESRRKSLHNSSLTCPPPLVLKGNFGDIRISSSPDYLCLFKLRNDDTKRGKGSIRSNISAKRETWDPFRPTFQNERIVIEGLEEPRNREKKSTQLFSFIRIVQSRSKGWLKKTDSWEIFLFWHHSFTPVDGKKMQHYFPFTHETE